MQYFRAACGRIYPLAALQRSTRLIQFHTISLRAVKSKLIFNYVINKGTSFLE
jgi:hypothetical protein